MITIEDVAKRANVSKGTVSKVLKNYPNISQVTKLAVQKAVKELGYIPNEFASGLSSKNSRRIALYIYINDQVQAIDEINMRYLFGAFSSAKEYQVQLITCFHDSISLLTKEEYVTYFRSIGADVIVVFGLNKEDEKMHYLLQQSEFRFVIIDAPIYDDRKTCIHVDHEQGQYEVAKTTVLAHEKVLYLAGKKNGYITDQRLCGMYRLQEELQLQMDVEYADFSEKKAFELVLEKAGEYDAIVCASDLMAIGSLKALKQQGLYRKLVGYDGISLMAYTACNVITCKQDFFQIGKRALEEAHRLLQGEKGREVIMPYRIGNIGYHDIIN